MNNLLRYHDQYEEKGKWLLVNGPSEALRAMPLGTAGKEQPVEERPSAMIGSEQEAKKSE